MYPWLVRACGQTPFISAKVDLDRASFCRTSADGLPSEPRGGERVKARRKVRLSSGCRLIVSRDVGACRLEKREGQGEGGVCQYCVSMLIGRLWDFQHARASIFRLELCHDPTPRPAGRGCPHASILLTVEEHSPPSSGLMTWKGHESR